MHFLKVCNCLEPPAGRETKLQYNDFLFVQTDSAPFWYKFFALKVSSSKGGVEQHPFCLGGGANLQAKKIQEKLKQVKTILRFAT